MAKNYSHPTTFSICFISASAAFQVNDVGLEPRGIAPHALRLYEWLAHSSRFLWVGTWYSQHTNLFLFLFFFMHKILKSTHITFM